MDTVKGTKHKQNFTDQPKKCDSCGRMFYAPYANGKWIVCPHCGKIH